MVSNRRTLLKALGFGASGSRFGFDTNRPAERPLLATSIPNEGAKKGNTSPSRTTFGPPADVGDGVIRTFVTSAQSGKPLSVGVRFTAEVLSGLPTATTDGTWEIPDGKTPCCGHETILAFPEGGKTIPFRWFMLNWNPDGHPPPDVYSVPHFDFHFYLMPRAKRDEIENGYCPEASTAVTCETLERGTEPLPLRQRPPEYESLSAVEPGMGNHLMDRTAPEFNGEPFTHTFLWGTFDGELIFFEPMVTRSFLRDLCTEIRVPIELPSAFPEPGWYPTEYALRYFGDRETYSVSLESFRWFET